MIRSYIYGGVALAGIALAGLAWWAIDRGNYLKEQNVALRGELSVQREIAEQAEMARAVANAYREREAARAAKLQSSLEALLTGEFDNAETPIDPWVADLLDCLRRNDPDEDCSAIGGP